MGSKSSPVQKRISFEDGHSSASDEDQNAVEVLFDPTNPYRRKSSLVAADATQHRPRRSQQPLPHDKAQCIVHQLFEGQRRASEDNHHNRHGRDHEHVHGTDATEEQGLNRIVEPKGGGNLVSPGDATPRNGAVAGPSASASASYKRRLDFLEGASDSSDAGQVDEKHWQRGITQSKSEIDVASQHEALHSRLLTKKQLSEMAWGVRELSRRLGSMRLKFKVKTIFLLTKIYDEDLIPKTRELTRWLLHKDRDVRYTVYIERSLKDNDLFDVSGLLEDLQKDYISADDSGDKEAGAHLSRRLRYWDQEICRTRPHTFDFVITLGGDGTVLYASWLFQRIVPPVLSFALGSLGFLTKFDFDEYKETLTTAFSHGVTVGLRLRFEGTIMRSQKKKKPALIASGADGGGPAGAEPKPDLVEELIGEEKDDEHTHRPDGTYEILNEIVIDRGPNPTMSSLEVFGDDEHFTSVLADGICVSTPTGSTAYNLAAGGSLCHPENPVMLVTAICAHTLSFRPIILPDTIVLRVGVPYCARTGSWASFDGRERIELHAGDYVTISASRYPFASVQAPGRRSEDWVNSISGKLGWNTRQKQKAYSKWET
ncbi:ATP NAD kinase [Magnaporthiopsis poae ATCC 64411]|uniref:ATP NAD kinase n=1 Tax=Magnaporthiopsis poae (strain ATCC 64411 / 73-15) TaxID=644358 RepID=A0A0C4E4H1_MAGP6|nr:ATP NAD kinase [Magnaporthiopsis poae ATCC 64411]